MSLGEGRLKDLVDANVADGGALSCHSTIYRPDVEPAVCRGFYDGHKDRIPGLVLAGLMGIVVLDPVPEKEDHRG